MLLLNPCMSAFVVGIDGLVAFTKSESCYEQGFMKFRQRASDTQTWTCAVDEIAGHRFSILVLALTLQAQQWSDQLPAVELT